MYSVNPEKNIVKIEWIWRFEFSNMFYENSEQNEHFERGIHKLKVEFQTNFQTKNKQKFKM